MLRQEIDRVISENEVKEQRIKDLELELKFSDFQRQGMVDGEMIAKQAEEAVNNVAQGQIMIDTLYKKNQAYSSNLDGLKSTEQ